jgi:hypothetical protein
MDSVSYIEAWHIWASGVSISQRNVFGIQILWWGRIGKIITVIGGLAVAALLSRLLKASFIGTTLAHQRDAEPELIRVIAVNCKCPSHLHG